MVGGGPNVRSSQYQSSFVILNLEDNLSLQNMDRDNDDLNDFEEVYVFHTNPFSNNTDNDRASDYEEVKAFHYGYRNSDPNDYTDTTPYRRLTVNAGGPYFGFVNHDLQFRGTVAGEHHHILVIGFLVMEHL